jgi:hypothetical protein
MPRQTTPKLIATVSEVYSSEDRLDNIVENRKKLGLEFFDLWLLDHLITKSRRRVYIPRTIQQLAERLDVCERMLQKSFKKLRDLDYVRRGQYRSHSYFIVDPLLINSGNAKQKAFKIKLWQESIQSKKAIHHDIQKSHSS